MIEKCLSEFLSQRFNSVWRNSNVISGLLSDVLILIICAACCITKHIAINLICFSFVSNVSFLVTLLLVISPMSTCNKSDQYPEAPINRMRGASAGFIFELPQLKLRDQFASVL